MLTGQYSSWTAFVADFELMCANALLYNQKRSRVHKTATSMLRHGRKQLQDIEAAGIKAILALNPKAVPKQSPAAVANGGPHSAPAALLHKAPPKAPPKPALRSPPKPLQPRKAPPPKKSRLAAHLLSGVPAAVC